MFQHQGIWLPDGEKHFPEWMTKNGELVNGRGTYQIKKIRAVLEECRRRGVTMLQAVDVGAHVGLWTMHLQLRFDFVHAFEPVVAYRECLRRNVGPEGNVVVYDCALGSAPGRVAMKIDPADTGGTHVAGPGEIEMRTLDSFGLLNVGLIKIDCEGYELEVLKGAEVTLRENKPVVIVEQKPHKLGPNFGIKGTPAVDFLERLGAKRRAELGGDYILSWD